MKNQNVNKELGELKNTLDNALEQYLALRGKLTDSAEGQLLNMHLEIEQKKIESAFTMIYKLSEIYNK